MQSAFRKHYNANFFCIFTEMVTGAIFDLSCLQMLLKTWSKPVLLQISARNLSYAQYEDKTSV